MKACNNFPVIFLLTIVLSIGSNIRVSAQTDVSFHYDINGNRINRIIELKKSSIEIDSIYKDETKKEIITEELGELKISIYPNPTKGKIRLILVGFDPSLPSSFCIFNINGILIENIEPATESKEIDLSGRADGVYILIISANNESSKWSIIKQ